MANPEFEKPDPELSDAVRDTERELLHKAFTDEPPRRPAEPEPAEPPKEPDQQPPPEQEEQPEEQAKGEPAKAERTRDEHGRFVKEGKPDAEKEQGEDAEQIPRWRVREIAEERRQAQAERDQLRAELARMQTRQFQQQRAAEPPPEIDPLLDPKGFVTQMRSEFQEHLRAERLNNNLAMAHMRHGETFEKAYSALVQTAQAGNAQLVQQLTSTPNPGEAIVGWYRQAELAQAAGGQGLAGLEKSIRTKLLNDPEFRKEVFAQVQSQNGQGSGPRPGNVSNITRLPPSLSRATGSSPFEGGGDVDDSDAALFARLWHK